jgi:hypothetical protein
VYRQSTTSANPATGLTLLGFVAVTLLAARIPAVARVLAGHDAVARLAVPQVFRVAGGVFLLVPNTRTMTGVKHVEGITSVLAGCVPLLTPTGVVVVVARPSRRGDHLVDASDADSDAHSVGHVVRRRAGRFS